MTDSHKKPPSKTLRLKPKAAPDHQAKAETPQGKKKPVRWSPLQRDRSRSTAEPAPAKPARDKTRPAAKAGTPYTKKDSAKNPARRDARHDSKPDSKPDSERRRRKPESGPATYTGTAPKGRSTLPSPAGGGAGGEGRAPGSGRQVRDQPVTGGPPARHEDRDRRADQPRRTDKPHRGADAGDAPRRRPAKTEPARMAFFAPCPRGLEALLGKELAHLGASDVSPASGGVGFTGDMTLAWRVNLWSRLAVRVLWQVGRGAYSTEEDLYTAALALPWPDWFAVDKTIAVRTVGHACPLKSLNFVTLRIKDALCDRFRQETQHRPNVETRAPDVPVLAYLDKDRYTFYLDLSGDPLNRRGYRVEPAPAPLNENLAAGLLMLSGWDPDMPLLDPMMGGGTILLEAAMISLNMAPGLKRHFAFEHLYGFDKVEWTRLRKDAEAGELEHRQLPIYGADIDPAMVRAAGLNLKAAGLLDCVTLREGDVLEIPAPGRVGMLISNPPYGVRLTVGQGASGPRPTREEIQPADFAVFYGALGDALKQRFAGWSAHLLSADPELPKEIGLKASKRTPLYNGPLDCRLYEYRIVEGTNRDKPAAAGE